MTRRANPYAFRLGYNQTWNSSFFTKNEKEQAIYLKRNKTIRDYFSSIGLDISRLKIEYTRNTLNINVYVTDTTVALGEGNNRINEILNSLKKIINEEKVILKVNIIGIKNIYSDAQAIAGVIVAQLKKRLRSRAIVRDVFFRMASERENKGAKIVLRGLIDGNDMAQTKKFFWGKIPLSTIDNYIDFGEAKAVTIRGVIGVKVFLNLGEKSPAKTSF